MQHSVLPVVLVLVLLISIGSVTASAASASLDWFDHIDRLYLSYYTQISASVAFSRSNAIWVYGNNKVTGVSASVNTAGTVTVFPLGSDMLELSDLPLGTELHVGMIFETAVEYTGTTIPYRVVLEYYDDSSLLYREVSGWVDAKIVNNGSVEIDAGFAFNGYFDQSIDAYVMPKHCSVRVEFKTSTGIPVKASITDISMAVHFTDDLKKALSPERFGELGAICFDLINTYWPSWFPENMSSAFNILTIFFSIDSPSTDMPDPPSVDNDFDINQGLGEITDILQQGFNNLANSAGAFAAVSILFGKLFAIPYVTELLYMSLCIGMFALLLNIPVSVDDGRNSKTRRSTRSTKKEAKTNNSGDVSGKDGA